MDAIFGIGDSPKKPGFRNEIIWCYSGGGQSKDDFPRKHDTILRYSKGKTWTFHGDAVRIPYDSNYKATVFAGEDTRAPGKTYLPHPDGKVVEDWWRGIARPYGTERTGYPTQKPLALYERIILASSNPDDTVLDPFCGCATTPIAAERLGRQWVGIDLWDGAYEQVIKRLESTGLAGPDKSPERLFTFGDVTLTTAPPERTDDGEEAAPELRLMSRRALARWQRLSHKEIVEHLVGAQANGEVVICAGCGRQLEREFMELDHILPRSDRGANDITNRILLCRPCNGRKGSRYTLSGLVAENRKAKWLRDPDMAKLANLNAAAMAERVKDELS